jgi:hypothetical protein
MKQKIKKFKLKENQRSICDHTDKEAVKRLDANEKRLEELEEQKYQTRRKTEWREFNARQNTKEIQWICARSVITKPDYIISSASTKAKPIK